MIGLDDERGSADVDRDVGGSDRIEDLPALVRTAARRWPQRRKAVTSRGVHLLSAAISSW